MAVDLSSFRSEIAGATGKDAFRTLSNIWGKVFKNEYVAPSMMHLFGENR